MTDFRNLSRKKVPSYMGENAFKGMKEFDNGYGVSVIRNMMSYGHEEGLYELAVLYKGELTYDSTITDDVMGWLTGKQVSEIMRKVEKL